jgi:hypothetical protein
VTTLPEKGQMDELVVPCDAESDAKYHGRRGKARMPVGGGEAMLYQVIPDSR